jgi:ATP-dependent RNA helicase DeaD
MKKIETDDTTSSTPAEETTSVKKVAKKTVVKKKALTTKDVNVITEEEKVDPKAKTVIDNEEAVLINKEATSSKTDAIIADAFVDDVVTKKPTAEEKAVIKSETKPKLAKKEKKSIGFEDLGLSSNLLLALEKKGFVTPSPIQIGVIPLLINGDKDIIGQAQTGTGKTAAFALPLLELLDPNKREIQAIIMAPTRELAVQVAAEIQSFVVGNPVTIQTIYGGNPMRTEIQGIKRKPTIIVGTPGRIQHHIRTNVLKLGTVKYFVLDEADEMLNFGFRKEIESILELTAPQRRVLLFSATMPKAILDIAKTHMGEYDSVKIDSKEMTNENITQKYFCIHNRDKIEALSRIMAAEEHFYAIVFCRTKSNTDAVASQLRAKHLNVEAIHGDIDQKNRTKILTRFKAGETKILVATDVAARGIDVAELNYVINFSLPESFEIYTHRIGRTGRAGNKGTAITFVTSEEMSRLRYFEKNLKTTLAKGTLPDAKIIIESKKTNLIDRIEHIINNEYTEDVDPIAKALLDEADPQKVVAALLKSALGNDFNVRTYQPIHDDTPRRGGFSSGRSSGSRSRTGNYASRSRSGGSSSRSGTNNGYRGGSSRNSPGSQSRTPRKGTGNSKGLKSSNRGKDAYKK